MVPFSVALPDTIMTRELPPEPPVFPSAFECWPPEPAVTGAYAVPYVDRLDEGHVYPLEPLDVSPQPPCAAPAPPSDVATVVPPLQHGPVFSSQPAPSPLIKEEG